MATIEHGYGKSPTGETPEQKAARKWQNHDIAKRFKEERATNKPAVPEPAVRVLTSSDANIERRRVKRLKTLADLRRLVRQLEDIVHSGRSTITVNGPELKDQRKREQTLAGYHAVLETRKRRLLTEKLKRLEATHNLGTN
jgi:hypothetical protein